MSERIPLGEREDLHREFKGRDALKKPEGIGRAVVAMLNADGGTVWIGLRDEKDRAVAVEPIPDVDTERRRLRDYLVDTIEPAPAGSDVEVEICEAEGEGSILCVHVRPQAESRPYAHLRGEGGRFFVVRVGDRVRPMTREEIARALGRAATRSDEPLEAAKRALLEEREETLKKGGERFWLAIRPARDLDLDLQDDRLTEYLQDPRATGNRLTGWNFSRFLEEISLRGGRLIAGAEDLARVEIRRQGAMTFSAPLGSLHWRGEDREIWPYILLELPISAFRMVSKVYEGGLKAEDRVVADLALIGLGGWKLRPGSPGTLRFFSPPEELTEAADFVLEKPLVFTSSEIETEPDRCGYRIVERVYEAFGLRREDISREFDAKAGRLVLPE